MITSPCKNCQLRYVGCHSKCLKYIDFRQSVDVLKEQVNEKKKPGSLYRSMKRDACERQRRRHQK